MTTPRTSELPENLSIFELERAVQELEALSLVDEEPEQPLPAPVEVIPPGNFIVRHWRGDFPLPFSFWVNGVLLSIILAMLLAIVSAALKLGPLIASAGQGASTAIAISHSIGAVLLVVAIWQWVGIWQSASKHVRRGGKALWAALAKVAVFLSLFGMASQTIADIFATFRP